MTNEELGVQILKLLEKSRVSVGAGMDVLCTILSPTAVRNGIPEEDFLANLRDSYRKAKENYEAEQQ